MMVQFLLLNGAIIILCAYVSQFSQEWKYFPVDLIRLSTIRIPIASCNVGKRYFELSRIQEQSMMIR